MLSKVQFSALTAILFQNGSHLKILNSNKNHICEPIWMKFDINKVFIKSSTKLTDFFSFLKLTKRKKEIYKYDRKCSTTILFLSPSCLYTIFYFFILYIILPWKFFTFVLNYFVGFIAIKTIVFCFDVLHLD